MANFTDLLATPAEQAADWIATANNYRTQCYTIIVSFTPEETALLRSMPDNGRDKVRTIIGDFLNELSVRGNDVSECPYIVARHDNTDNEHYHIVIRTTDINGKRFRDNFINKNANRAAACIALRYGLEAPKKAAEREKAHQERLIVMRRKIPDRSPETRQWLRDIIGMKNNLNQIARHVNTQKQCDQWAIDALKYIATELSKAKKSLTNNNDNEQSI